MRKTTLIQNIYKKIIQKYIYRFNNIYEINKPLGLLLKLYNEERIYVKQYPIINKKTNSIVLYYWKI